MVFVAIFLHKLPEGVTISSLMVAAGRTRGEPFGRQRCSESRLVGVVVTDEVSFLVQHGLALSAGVTDHVAASNLVPEFV
jgi:ZIP family zinc transporter/zinc and cadmium transporter